MVVRDTFRLSSALQGWEFECDGLYYIKTELGYFCFDDGTIHDLDPSTVVCNAKGKLIHEVGFESLEKGDSFRCRSSNYQKINDSKALNLSDGSLTHFKPNTMVIAVDLRYVV
jgi:hypothetical protein